MGTPLGLAECSGLARWVLGGSWLLLTNYDSTTVLIGYISTMSLQVAHGLFGWVSGLEVRAWGLGLGLGFRAWAVWVFCLGCEFGV